MDAVDKIVAEVLRRLGACSERVDVDKGAPSSAAQNGIPAEMSARHVHLTVSDLKKLFGTEEMPVSRMISQPGQYLSTLRVRLIGPKGAIENVAVLGPARTATQVEISATDARALGINAPVRLSGDLNGAATVFIQAGKSMLQSDAAIVAKRHLHMLPSDAQRYGVSDGQRVCVRVLGARPLILEDVPVRVTDTSALALHIDTDEANASGLGKDGRCEIVKAESLCSASPVSSSIPSAAPNPTPACSKSESHSDGACSAIDFKEKLLTEDGVRELCKNSICEVRLAKNQLVTPLARDTAKVMGLKIITEDRR